MNSFVVFNFQRHASLLKYPVVCSDGLSMIHFSTKVYWRVVQSRVTTHFNVNKPRGFLRCQQISWTMEPTAVVTETPVEVNSPVSLEGDSLKQATRTGKRKSDEPDKPETSVPSKRCRGRKKPGSGERYIPPPQRRNPCISQEHFNETSYYFEGGLRKVRPYYYDFKTYCKGRWIGKSLLEVFKSEFRAESTEYYQRAAKEGRIRLNETTVEDLSVVLRVSIISTIVFYV